MSITNFFVGITNTPLSLRRPSRFGKSNARTKTQIAENPGVDLSLNLSVVTNRDSIGGPFPDNFRCGGRAMKRDSPGLFPNHEAQTFRASNGFRLRPLSVGNGFVMAGFEAVNECQEDDEDHYAEYYSATDERECR
jgi:hypothetical protein